MAEQYKRRIGDRREGRLLRSLSPLMKLMPFVSVSKTDAVNFFRDSIEVGSIEHWLRAKRAEGFTGMGMQHLFIAAYVRVVAMRPGLNRFVSGQRIFARRSIHVVLSLNRAQNSDAAEALVKVRFDPSDTVFDVYRKLGEAVDDKKAEDGSGGINDTAIALLRLPRVIRKFAMWLTRLLDYFDLLPRKFLSDSPFHGSMAICDYGTLGVPPLYHHLGRFGNLPLFFSFGTTRRALEPGISGQPEELKFIDYTAVIDDRICDGAFIGTSLKYMKYYLKNPLDLEEPPERVEQDVF